MCSFYYITNREVKVSTVKFFNTCIWSIVHYMAQCVDTWWSFPHVNILLTNRKANNLQWKIVLGLGQSCSSMIKLLCTKWAPWRHGLPNFEWNKSSGLNKAMTSSPVNTFEMNWNSDCAEGLLALHRWLNLLMLLWMTGQKFPQSCSKIYWKAFLKEWWLL